MMKYKETTDYSFLLDENYYVYDHKEDMETLHIFIKSKRIGCRCPKCGTESRKLHATYERILQDTPIRCKQTFLHANVYKYDCLNPECDCIVFMEELPFAKASQVRTDALNTLVLGVSMYLSNEGASKVLGLLGIRISNDTIQRLYDRIGFVDNPDVEEVGIDDVAIRKGQTYATAIYDLKDHHLIALLEGREGEALRNWLEHHKKIRLVARDRASAYAAAISAVLPDCVQVADRFHLLQNLLEHLKDIFKEELPAKIFIRDGKVLDQEPQKIPQEKRPDDAFLATLHYDNTPPRNPDGTEMAYDNKKHDFSSEQYRTQAKSRKKTVPDPAGSGILGRAGQKNDPERGRDFRAVTAHRKKIHPYDRGRNNQSGCASQLQEAGFANE